MPSASDAGLRHAVCFYNIVLDINRAYLQGGQRLMGALSLFDLDWDNIERGQAWSTANFVKYELAAQVCRRISVLEILDLRQQFEQRINWLQSGFEASELLADIQGKADTTSKLGIVHAKKGALDTAISYYEKALALYIESSDKLGESNQLGNLGMAYAANGDVKKAIQYYEKALIIDKEIKDRRGV